MVSPIILANPGHVLVNIEHFRFSDVDDSAIKPVIILWEEVGAIAEDALDLVVVDSVVTR